MTTYLDKIEELARAATPGRWRDTWGSNGSEGVEWDLQMCVRSDAPGDPLQGLVIGTITCGEDLVACHQQDAAYIAAVSPDVVLNLVAELRAARAVCKAIIEADERRAGSDDAATWEALVAWRKLKDGM